MLALIYLNANLTLEDHICYKKFSFLYYLLSLYYFYLKINHDYFTVRKRGAFPLKKKTFKVYDNCSNTEKKYMSFCVILINFQINL